MRRRLLTSLVLAALAATARAPLSAQVPGISLQLVPRIGGYFPAAELGEVRSGFRRIQTELETSLALGLSLELDMPASAFNLRANFDYATGTKVSGKDLPTGGLRAGASPSFAAAAAAAQEEGEVEATLLGLTGDLVLRPLPRVILVQPYLLAGAGVKVYDFKPEEATSGNLRDAFSEDRSDFTLHAGAGIDLKLGSIALLVEASDYLSWFETQSGQSGETGERQVQHDIFAMVGFRVGLF